MSLRGWCYGIWNCSCLEIGHFQGTKESLVHCQSRIRTVDHWHDDTTREAFVADAEGEGVRDMKVVIREFPFFVAFNLA